MAAEDQLMGFAAARTSAQARASPLSPACTLADAGRTAATGNQARLRRLQAKLTVGAVDDPLEREADATAEQVMRMADPAITRAAPARVSRACAACEEKDALHRRGESSAVDAGEAPVLAALAAPGHPLVSGVCDAGELDNSKVRT
jgi:hypothetical protein